jgi:two-component system, OmpR family, response regulator
VNEFFARLYERKRTWFAGKNRFEEFPELSAEWKEIIRTVADTRETYVDRSFRCLPHLPKKQSRWNWNILVFPLKLHDNRNGAVLAARVIEKK